MHAAIAREIKKLKRERSEDWKNRFCESEVIAEPASSETKQKGREKSLFKIGGSEI